MIKQLPEWDKSFDKTISEDAYNQLKVKVQKATLALKTLYQLYLEDGTEETYIVFYRVLSSLDYAFHLLKPILPQWFKSEAAKFENLGTVEILYSDGTTPYSSTMFFDLWGALTTNIVPPSEKL